MDALNFKNLLTLSTLLAITTSCSDIIDINQKFNNKYSDQVKKINEQIRIQERDFIVSGSGSSFNSNPEFKLYSTPSQILANQSPVNNKASFETYKLYLKTPQNYLPNNATYKTGNKNSAANRIPNNLFELNYGPYTHPPFRVTGIDFDIIAIPDKDAYGVPSSLDRKSYPLVSNRYIANNVRNMTLNRKTEDIEFTEDLISEQKAIKKQIIVNNLYQDDNRNLIRRDPYSIDNSEEEWVLKKRKIRNDPVNLTIRSQVVSKNLITNKLSSLSQKKNRKKPKEPKDIGKKQKKTGGNR